MIHASDQQTERNMNTPAIFSIVQINGRSYRLQNVQACADGSQEWMVSKSGAGTMYTVSVSAGGTFGAPVFAY